MEVGFTIALAKIDFRTAQELIRVNDASSMTSAVLSMISFVLLVLPGVWPEEKWRVSHRGSLKGVFFVVLLYWFS